MKKELILILGILLGVLASFFLQFIFGGVTIEKTVYTEIEKCKELGGFFWYWEGGDDLFCDINERINIDRK